MRDRFDETFAWGRKIQIIWLKMRRKLLMRKQIHDINMKISDILHLKGVLFKGIIF